MHENIYGNSLLQFWPLMELHLNSLDFKDSSKYKIMSRDLSARNFFPFVKQFLLARSSVSKAMAEFFIYTEVNLNYANTFENYTVECKY